MPGEVVVYLFGLSLDKWLPGCRFHVVASTLSRFSRGTVFKFSSKILTATLLFIVCITPLPFPRCRFRVVASTLSLPRCRFYVVTIRVILWLDARASLLSARGVVPSWKEETIMVIEGV